MRSTPGYEGILDIGKAETLEEPVKHVIENELGKGHIPNILWHHRFDNPASAIQGWLGMNDVRRDSRVLHLIVFRELRPSTQLEGDEYIKVWWQCVVCEYLSRLPFTLQLRLSLHHKVTIIYGKIWCGTGTSARATCCTTATMTGM